MIKTKVLNAATIPNSIVGSMYKLFEEYYSDVSFADFEKDLRNKKDALVFFDKKANVVGFTTILHINKKLANGSNATFIFSGDTVVDRKYWGKKILQKAFYRYVVKLVIIKIGRPVYWMLMSKGHKTFMILKKNFMNSYPDVKKMLPADIKEAMDEFYTERFGSAYKKEKGLIVFDSSKGAVKNQFADATVKALEDKNLQLFMKLNPDYKMGHELACIARVSIFDFIFALPKYFLIRWKASNTWTAVKEGPN